MILRAVSAGIVLFFLFSLTRLLTVETKLAYLTSPNFQKDEELKAHFFRHRPAFERLREMFLEDAKVLERIGLSYVRPVDYKSAWSAAAHGMSRERLREYRRLFQELGLPGGMGGGHGYVYFVPEGHGPYGKGQRKTIEWVKPPPKPLRNTLDPYRFDSNYVRITGDWYIRLVYEGK